MERRPSEMGELVDEIASYRNTADAIGYSVYYYIKNMYMQEGVKLLSVNGVAPRQRDHRRRRVSLHPALLRGDPRRRGGGFPRASALQLADHRRRPRADRTGGLRGQAPGSGGVRKSPGRIFGCGRADAEIMAREGD